MFNIKTEMIMKPWLNSRPVVAVINDKLKEIKEQTVMCV